MEGGEGERREVVKGRRREEGQERRRWEGEEKRERKEKRNVKESRVPWK